MRVGVALYKFNAKELDNETGLYYYGARYYTPELSIWLSVDPLSDNAPGWSPYRYGFNSPVRFTDPNGLFESESDAKQWAMNNDIINDDGIKSGYRIEQGSDGSWAINNREKNLSYFRDNTDFEGYMAGRGEDGVIAAAGAFADRCAQGGGGREMQSEKPTREPFFTFVGFNHGIPEFESSLMPKGTAVTPGPFIIYSTGYSNDASLNTHEPGHVIQFLIMGPYLYYKLIAIPSLMTVNKPYHSDMPWEKSANTLWYWVTGIEHESNPRYFQP